jgi:8-amino-7-oxononanoate synthase
MAPQSPSPIVSVIIGEERAALHATERLLELGFLVPAIRPPSVPPGTARLRVAVSAAHEPAQINALRAALDEVVAEPAHA